MCAVAESFGLAHEEKAREIQNWQEFFDWRYEVMEEGYAYPGRRAGEQIEGFVIEDSGGYMTKLKLPYYNFWKRMRTVAREVAKKDPSATRRPLRRPRQMSSMDGSGENMIPGN